MREIAEEVKMNSKAMLSLEAFHTDVQVLADQQEPISKSCVQTLEDLPEVMNGERESRKSVLTTRNDFAYIYIYIYIKGARSRIALIVGNRNGDTSSNP